MGFGDVAEAGETLRDADDPPAVENSGDSCHRIVDRTTLGPFFDK